MFIKTKFIIVILLSGLFLSGCIKNAEELGVGNFNNPYAVSTITPEPTPVIEEEGELGAVRTRQIGIPSCDRYLTYLSCTTQQLQTEAAESVINGITEEWAILDTETLTARCDQTIKEIQESPQQYSNGLSCSI